MNQTPKRGGGGKPSGDVLDLITDGIEWIALIIAYAVGILLWTVLGGINYGRTLVIGILVFSTQIPLAAASGDAEAGADAKYSFKELARSWPHGFRTIHEALWQAPEQRPPGHRNAAQRLFNYIPAFLGSLAISLLFWLAALFVLHVIGLWRQDHFTWASTQVMNVLVRQDDSIVVTEGPDCAETDAVSTDDAGPYMVSGASVIRRGPDQSYVDLGTLKKGDAIQVLGWSKQKAWAYISKDGAILCYLEGAALRAAN